MGKKLDQYTKKNKQILASSLGKKRNLPLEIRQISVSLFIFIFGWGLGGDTFFSIYVNSIVPSPFGITLIGAFLALIKLITVLPVGILNDKGSTRYLLLLGKIMYAVSGVFYFLAGFHSSVVLLIFAVLFNGIGSSSMFTTYRTLYGKKSKKTNRSKVFGIYFSSMNLAYVIGALISAFLVQYIELPFLYLFIVIFALLSLLQDEKIQIFFQKKFSTNWNSYSRKKEKKPINYEIDEGMQRVRKLLGKKGVIALLSKELFSLSPWKKVFAAIKGYGRPMYTVLANQSLVSFLSYVSYLFIPLIAVQNHLSLPQIAILFAVMKSPYLINIFIGSLGDKYSKKLITGVVLSCIAVSFFFLGLVSDFRFIVLFSFIGALGIAILSPIASALISGYAKAKDAGVMSALQEFMGKGGEILGSLGFGVLVALIGMNFSFILVGVSLFVLGMWIVIKKLLRIKNHDNEAEKEVLAVQPYFSESS